jgi:hypothetical protein
MFFLAIGPAIAAAAAAAAAAAQAKAQRDAMQVYRDIGMENMKSLLGDRCEYCHSNHRSNYCPSCGAPTKAQQRRNEGGYPERQSTSRAAMPISVVYGVQALRPSTVVKLESSMGNQNAEADRKKRRDSEDEAAARRRRNDTSYSTPDYTPPAPSYSPPDTSSDSGSSYSGGGGSFDGGGASGDY